MRNLLVIIILAGAGYYGWQAYQKDPKFFTKYLPNQAEEAQPAESEEVAPEATPGSPAGTAPVPAPPAPPTFVSKIVIPSGTNSETQKLPPGQFLVLERASVETKDGITAIVPGDLVKLIERRPNGTLKVTNGQYDFVVKESQVTQDVAVARQAEEREFQRRYGTLR